MSEVLNVYACRSCDHTQFAETETEPDSCEKCGGVLNIIHGVQVKKETGEETKKYAHELSR